MTKLGCPQVQVAVILGGHFVYRTKPIFKRGRSFDKSNPLMKFGSDWVINY